MVRRKKRYLLTKQLVVAFVRDQLAGAKAHLAEQSGAGGRAAAAAAAEAAACSLVDWLRDRVAKRQQTQRKVQAWRRRKGRIASALGSQNEW